MPRPPTPSVRLLNDGVCPPELNMARDYALFEAFERGEIPPTLRVYQWASPAMTYGANQQLPPRLIEDCERLGIPTFRRPTGGKAVLHGHDLTLALVFEHLTPLSPLPVNGEGGVDAVQAHGSPSPFTERGQGGEVRIYPRQVYLQLAPALIEAFWQVGVPAAQGDAAAPDPRSFNDGGDCFATPAIADIVHAETGIKLMGCALLVRGAKVLMQASIPLRVPDVPVEALFGHAHPEPPPLESETLVQALYPSIAHRLTHSGS